MNGSCRTMLENNIPGLILIAPKTFYDGLDRRPDPGKGQFRSPIRTRSTERGRGGRGSYRPTWRAALGNLNLQPFAKRTPGLERGQNRPARGHRDACRVKEQRKIRNGGDLTRAFAETGGKDREALKRSGLG